MAGAQDRDYSRSRAVLIGTWKYRHLSTPELPAVRNSLSRMAALLKSDLCGWPSDRIEVISNQPRPGDLPDRLAEMYDGVEDVALFYYVGHGQSDSDNKLCLGLVDTRSESKRRATTSLEFEDVRRALRDCHARTKIVILDCCFAGLAIRTEGLLTTKPDVAVQAGGTGAFTMAASGYTTFAQFEQHGPHPQTHFTKGLADIVETHGISGEPSGLKLGPIFNRLRNDLLSANLPEPTALNRDSAAEYVFARNRAQELAGSTVVAPVVAPSPPVDVLLVSRPPREIVDAAAELPRSEADQLLAAVTARRTGQELAALVDLLRSEGRDADIETVVRGVAAQPAEKVVELLSALHSIGLEQDATTLLRHARLAELVTALWPVRRRVQPATALVDWFLSGVAGLRDSDIVTVVDALRSVGQSDHAAKLIELAVKARQTMPETADLLAALWPVLGSDPVKTLLQIDNAVMLAEVLRHNGRPLDANRVMATVAARPASEIATTLMTLVSAGRDVELAHLLLALQDGPDNVLTEAMELLADRRTVELIECLAAFQRAHAEQAVDLLLKALVADGNPFHIAGVMAELPGAERDRLVSEVADYVATTGPWRGPSLTRRLLEQLIKTDRDDDVNLLLDKLAAIDRKVWRAVVARTASELRRAGRTASAAELTDRVWPSVRRDSLRFIPHMLIAMTGAFLIGRAFIEAQSRSDAAGGLALLSAMVIVLGATHLGPVLTLPRPVLELRTAAEKQGWTAAQTLPHWMLGVAAIAGLARADWLGVGVIGVGVLIAVSSVGFWYDISGWHAGMFLVFEVACVIVSVTAPGWQVFVPGVLAAALPMIVVAGQSRVRRMWIMCVLVTVAGASLQWGTSGQWLTSTAATIGRALSWGVS